MLFPVSASDPVPALEGMDDDMGFSLPPVLAEEKEEPEESVPRPQPRRQVCRRMCHHLSPFINFVYCVVIGVFVLKGNKRQAVEESSDLASSASSHPTDRPSGARSLPLKARYGIHAWKRWALSASDLSDNTKVKDDSKPGNLLPWLSCYSPYALLGWK